jgi:hypothetical protein
MATTRLIWRSAFGSFRWRRRLRFAYPPHDVVLSWVVRVDCPSRLGSEREQSALPAKSAPERVPTLIEAEMQAFAGFSVAANSPWVATSLKLLI